MNRVSKLLIAMTLILFTAHANEAESILKFGDRFYGDSLFSQALEQYERYLQLSIGSEKSAEVLLKVGQIHEREGNVDQAFETYTQIIEDYPSSPQIKATYMKRAFLNKKEKRYRDAASDFQQVWKKYNSSVSAKEAIYQMGICSELAGLDDRADEFYRKFIVRFSSDKLIGEVEARLIKLLITNKAYSDAKEEIAAALLRVTDAKWRAEIEAYDAKILYVTAETAKARNVYRALLAKGADFPSLRDALNLYGEILLESTDASNEDLSKAVSRFTQTYGAVATAEEIVQWGTLQLKAGKVSEGVRFLTGGLDVEGVDSARILYTVARGYAMKNDLMSSIETLKKIKGDKSSVYKEKAVVKAAELYTKNGLYSNAIEEYRSYLNDGFTARADFALYSIAQVYQKKINSPELALKEYDKFLKWYPNSNYTLNALWESGQIYESIKDLQKALFTYKYLASLYSGAPLAEKALKRADYLEKYRIADVPGAVNALADITFDFTLSKEEKLLKGSTIYRTYLKNFYKGIELLDSILVIEGLQSGTKGTALLEVAETWSAIYKKMKYESSTESAKVAYTNAVSYYDKVIANSSFATLHDRAKYKKIAALDGSIPELESFIAQNQNSKYLVDAVMEVASFYETKAEQDKSFYEKVAQYYVTAYEKGGIQQRELALSGLTNSLLQRGKLDSARIYLNEYKTGAERNIKKELLWWLEGRLLKGEGKFQEASVALERLISHFPEGDYVNDGRLLLGECYYTLGNMDKALREYTLAASFFKIGGKSVSSRLGKARTLGRLGRLDDAKTELESLVMLSVSAENKAAIHYEMGQVYELLSRKYESVKQYILAMKSNSPSLQFAAQKRLAELRYDLREYASAAVNYDNLIKQVANSKDSVHFEARYLSSSILAGNVDKVSKRYKDFRKGAGKDNEAYLAEIVFAEGLYAYRTKDFKKAEKRLSFLASKLTSTDFVDDAAYYRSLIKYDSGDYDGAIQSLLQVTIAYPESDLIPSVNFTIAAAYKQQEKYADAANYYKKVSSMDEADDELKFRALMNGALSWQKINLWEEAGALYSEIYEKFPDRVQQGSFTLRTGFAWYKADRIRKAMKYFEISEKIGNKDDRAETAYWIATCNGRLGKTSEALEQFLKIPYLYGYGGKWGITAEFEAARIYKQQEKYDQALSLYSKVIRKEGKNSPIGSKALEEIAAIKTLQGDI